MRILISIMIPLICLLTSCDQQISETEAPYSVGIPPQNAYTGLVLLEDGEVRHYGSDIYISSRDQGVSWDTINVANGNYYGKRSPKTGDYLRLFSGRNDTFQQARKARLR